MKLMVEGSKNGFEFGPDEIEIPDDTEEETAAVLDAVLQADDPDGLESALPEQQRHQRNAARAPQDRAAQYGFTALRYTRRNGDVIRIL
jgi:hypothetical protein